LFNLEIFTKEGQLKKNPPKKYQCKNCLQKTSKPRGLKMTGMSFSVCGNCGGTLMERDEYKEWFKRDSGQWDMEQWIILDIESNGRAEKKELEERFADKSWLFSRALADLCYHQKLNIEKDNEKYYYSMK
jgi:hypothetical protein